MLRPALVFVVLVGLAQPVLAQSPGVFSPTERPSPGFQVFQPDGEVATSKAYSGNVLVLTFWASWCSPCLRELPHLQALHEAYADDDRVAVLAINIGEGEPEADATRFWTSTAYTMPYAYDRTSFIYATFGATAIPATYIIDGSGTIRYEAYGIANGDAYEAEVRGYVDALLGD